MKIASLSELGITEEELDALLATREILALGVKVGEAGFDMSTPIDRTNKNHTADPVVTGLPEGKTYHCGSALCIGGWMKLIMLNVMPAKDGNLWITDEQETKISNYVYNEKIHYPIFKLFYPDHDFGPRWSPAFESITKEQAVKAIDNFLAFADPKWNEILTYELNC